MGKSLLGGIIGGIILFIWGSISWMVLPWHNNTLHSFQNESAVSQSILQNAPQSGVYLLPNMSAKNQQNTTGPVILASVHLEKSPGMGLLMFRYLLIEAIAAFLVTWMLLQTNLTYGSRVIFVVIFALAAGIVGFLPPWNWFGFSTDWTLVSIADLLIGWLLAGLAIARIRP